MAVAVQQILYCYKLNSLFQVGLSLPRQVNEYSPFEVNALLLFYVKRVTN